MIYDQHLSSFLLTTDPRNLRVQFTDMLCYFLIISGFIGNIFGLCIFSSCRRTWRISSVYVYLATCSSLINVFCIIRYASVLHSKSRLIIRELVGYTWLGCKFYEFSFSFRIISSWITLFWMFERLTCVSKRLRTIFYRWNASQLKLIVPFTIILLLLVGILGPSLYMYHPQLPGDKLVNSSTNIFRNYCGLSSRESVKWQKYFYDVHFGPNHHTIRCIFSELIPAGAIVLFNSYIIYYLIQTSRHLIQTRNNQLCQSQQHKTSWMNVILLLHSSLFLFSLFSHIIGHFMHIEAHETWWVLLSILANCSLNFYVYCLSGTAFRQQIIRFIQQFITHKLYKLQVRKQQWKQRQCHFKEDHFICNEMHLEELNQLTAYQLKNNRKSNRMNSSCRTCEDESST